MTADEFTARWHRFVRHWARTGRDVAAWIMVDDLLSRGLVALTDSLPLLEPEGEQPAPTDQDLARCERAVVRSSSLFDAKAYRRANAEVRSGKLDPAEHYCTSGWRLLRNPSLGFDVWWYWSEYLDPSVDDIDPLLHYLLVGRWEGAEPLPPREPFRPATAYEDGHRPRRVCLFAGYDQDGVIDDYVVDYLREMSRHADVYYLADGFILPEQLRRLDEVARGAWAVPHGAYDFGSYSMLARDLVGWDTIDGYDEVVLANDSGFLIRPLDEVFSEMDSRTCDWWGLQMTRHDFERHSNGGLPLPIDEVKACMVGERFMSELDHLHISSYFLVFRKPVLQDPGFRKRLDGVSPQSQKVLVIYKYEIGLSRYLMCRGFDFSTFVDALYPFHPLYTAQYFDLLELGFPILKRNFLSENSRNVPDLVRWRERVGAAVPDADLDVVERNLIRVSEADSLYRSFSFVTGDDGRVSTAPLLVGREFADEDRWAPKFDHWWAFLVCPLEHTVPGNLRAVFEEVRTDPSIKKIVLTRSRTVEVDGPNVVVVPLKSPEGQRYLTRAGQVFVTQTPRASVQFPVSGRRHRFIHVGASGSLRRHGHAATVSVEGTAEENARCHAVVTSPALDRLASAAAFFPLTFDQIWPTGAPRNDLLTRDLEALPEDLQAQERRLRKLLGGRRLVLFTPTYDPQQGGYPVYGDDQLAWLDAWCKRHDVVLGFRDDPADPSRLLARMLHPLGALRLTYGQFASTEVHDRVASAMITDHSHRAAEFLVTERPLVSLVAQPAADELFFDLDSLLPGSVCRNFESLAEALECLLQPPDGTQRARYARQRRLLHGEVDDRNAERLVRRVKELYVR